MLPVLLASSKGEVRIGAVVGEPAIQYAGLRQKSVTEVLCIGKQTVFSNRVHWVSYLTKAGLINITRRGYFTIAQPGQKLIDSKPTHIDNKLLMQFEEFRQFRERSNEISIPHDLIATPAIDDQKQTPDEVMRLAHKQIDTALAQELLDRIREAPPDFFERLIVKPASPACGGGSTEGVDGHLVRSGDDGVDGVIDQDALGLDRVLYTG